MWFIHIHILSWFRSNLMLKIIALCQGTFNFKGSNMLFSSFVSRFSRTLIPYQFREIRNEQSCMQFSGLRSWERAPAWIPFSDSLQWPYLNVIYSVMTLLLRIWNAFWPFEDCYLLGYVFAQFFYCLKLPCMKMYKHAFLQIKHPCFTWDLVPLRPSSHQLQSPGPGLQRPWH